MDAAPLALRHPFMICSARLGLYEKYCLIFMSKYDILVVISFESDNKFVNDKGYIMEFKFVLGDSPVTIKPGQEVDIHVKTNKPVKEVRGTWIGLDWEPTKEGIRFFGMVPKEIAIGQPEVKFEFIS